MKINFDSEKLSDVDAFCVYMVMEFPREVTIYRSFYRVFGFLLEKQLEIS